jgi:hypothetical protein
MTSPCSSSSWKAGGGGGTPIEEMESFIDLFKDSGPGGIF